MLEKLERDRRPHDTYTRILLAEEEYARLLAHVQQQPSRIESFCTHLKPHFPDEVKVLFLAWISAKAGRSSSRRDYADTCRIIQLLFESGGEEEAYQAANRLLSEYANKPAFRDELIKWGRSRR